jgi:hypothetical protein
MNSRAKKSEAANQLANKIAAQQPAPERVADLLGSQPSTWENADGRNYEWVIPATTAERLTARLFAELRRLGCKVFDVDASTEPYYLVCVRLIEPRVE